MTARSPLQALVGRLRVARDRMSDRRRTGGAHGTPARQNQGAGEEGLELTKTARYRLPACVGRLFGRRGLFFRATVDDVNADVYAFVADVDAGTGDQLPHFLLRLVAERAVEQSRMTFGVLTSFLSAEHLQPPNGIAVQRHSAARGMVAHHDAASCGAVSAATARWATRLVTHKLDVEVR
jgi:hypothetical protein